MEASAKQQVSNIKEKPNNSTNFGWNVFNSDTLYSAYENRCKNMVFNQEQYDE